MEKESIIFEFRTRYGDLIKYVCVPDGFLDFNTRFCVNFYINDVYKYSLVAVSGGYYSLRNLLYEHFKQYSYA